MPKVTVLGGGAMGTACAILLAEHAGQVVSLWLRNADFAADLAATRENHRLLPGVKLPPSVDVTADLDRALADAELYVLAIPSAYLRAAMSEIAPLARTGCPVVSVIKGIENDTFLRPSQIIREVLGEWAVCSLSGPSHAEEVTRRLPASVVAAADDLELARRVQTLFSTDRFRVYTNSDLLGVELAGALKNVVAIAAGICDGLGYGDNAKAALLTRGLVEITRFGTMLGAAPETFSGLAGVGDLITTCFSPYGRNRKVGERLGRGEALPQILSSMVAVAEGVPTTRSVYGLALQRGIDMPITSEIHRVLFEGKSPAEATQSLMQRPLRNESRGKPEG
ncbi:MAG: NAD(P)-dependent glycerol-3-phosphate dehydrogenase [Planctomycetales bacterium]|nr:NAD(P)-dependent glycerol-3-phosphate dehydrogenase [Planctomycetales bacterium]